MNADRILFALRNAELAFKVAALVFDVAGLGPRPPEFV